MTWIELCALILLTVACGAVVFVVVWLVDWWVNRP